MADDRIEFGVLGPLEVTVGGTPLALGTPKQRAVLALLVINRNRLVDKDTLIDAAWEHNPPPGARPTLHSYVSNLRRLMVDAGIDARSILTGGPPGYRIIVDDSSCDIGRFLTERKAGLVAAAAGQFEDASRHLSRALAEWRGPALNDLRYFDFADDFAKEQTENKLVAQTALAEAEIACGRAFAIIGELEALAAEHPYREPVWAQLITAYYLAERQSDALGAYRRLKTTLAEDLGIDPGPTLRTLHDRILRQLTLDVQKAAQSRAEDTIALDNQSADAGCAVSARLRGDDGQSYALVGVTTRIGRNPDNDVVLADASVSRHHAVIVVIASSCVITDLGSRNGVRVFGQRIRTSHDLKDGDRVSIGGQELTFEIRSGKPADSRLDERRATPAKTDGDE